MRKQEEDEKLSLKEIFYVILVVLLFIAITVQAATFMTMGTNSYRQYIIYKQVKEQVPDLLLEDWEIAKIDLFTISKTRFGDYSVYVEVRNYKIREWTNDLVITDKHGNILEEELTYNMRLEE